MNFIDRWTDIPTERGFTVSKLIMSRNMRVINLKIDSVIYNNNLEFNLHSYISM